MAIMDMADSATDRLTRERRFYGRMILAIMLAIFIGFAPSFYLFQTVSYPRPNPPLTAMTMLHGMIFTAWLGIFYTQTELVAANRRDIHKRLGLIGFSLALAMVPIMYLTSVQSIARAMQPPFIDPVGWSAVPLLSIIPITAMLFLGWRYRTSPQIHKRFMLLSTIMMIEPGVGRWPVFPPSEAGVFAGALVSFTFILPLLIWDYRTTGRIHWATKTGLLLFAFECFARFAVWNSRLWHDFVAILPGI